MGRRRLQRAVGLIPTIPPPLQPAEVFSESVVSIGKKLTQQCGIPAHLPAGLISRADFRAILSLNQFAIL